MTLAGHIAAILTLRYFLSYNFCASPVCARPSPDGGCGTNGHANARVPSAMHLKCTIRLQRSQGAKVGQCVEPSCEGCDSPLSCAYPFNGGSAPDRGAFALLGNRSPTKLEFLLYPLSISAK